MSTLPPNKKNVNGTVINKNETLCTFSFVYNPDSTKGMFAYPKEGDITPIKIQNMVIKSEGNYEYYDNDGNHAKNNHKNKIFAKDVYNIQKTKYTDGVLTPEEARMSKGGYKRKSKSQRRKKSKSHRRRKSIKRRH